MKKLASIMIALVLAATATVSAFAAGINSNEQKVLDELKSVNISGVTISADYINQAEGYFNKIEMTADQSATIIKAINDVENYVKAAGVKDLRDLSLDQKNVLLGYLKTAGSALGLTVSFDGTAKLIIVKDAEGATVFSGSPYIYGSASSGNATVGDKNVIKTTGAETNFMGFGIAVLLQFFSYAAVRFTSLKLRKKELDYNV